MNTRALALAVVLLLGFAGSARAQNAELERTLHRLAAFWARGDAAAVATLATRAGLSLDLDGAAIGPLGPRQAEAVLRRIFDQHVTVQLRTGTARVVGGAPPRAFGELSWLSRIRGTTIPEHATVFLALVREENGWRITQIRLMP